MVNKRLPKNWHTLYTSEINRKRSLALKGTKKSEVTREKMSVKKKGRKGYWKNKTLPKGFNNKGEKLSEERRKKISESKKGVKCNFWQGGIWHNPYSENWTSILKRSIRQRDKYTCQICGKEPAIQVHHIDYDKNNCCPDNLITLCKSCHSKTNCNRNYWTHYFMTLLTWRKKYFLPERVKGRRI